MLSLTLCILAISLLVFGTADATPSGCDGLQETGRTKKGGPFIGYFGKCCNKQKFAEVDCSKADGCTIMPCTFVGQGGGHSLGSSGYACVSGCTFAEGLNMDTGAYELMCNGSGGTTYFLKVVEGGRVAFSTMTLTSLQLKKLVNQEHLSQ